MNVAPGVLLGERYQIDRALARGGMGQVWVATDMRFNAPVAIKLAVPPADGREEFRARFRREAVIGRLLGSRSTGFVRALDWGEVDGEALFLVMDLIEGGQPLDVAQGPRPERLGRLILAARLVQELHALGIVHRDLKPQNFFLAADGGLRLGDFGLARLADEPDDAEGAPAGRAASAGTPGYMALEQLEGRHVDQRADVYPLGVMLFQALTGRLPFDGPLPQVFARQQRVLKGQEPLPRPRQHDHTIPGELEALCLEALQPDPTRRLRSAVAFADRLEQWLKRSGGAPAPPARPATGRPTGTPPSLQRGKTSAAPPPPPPGLSPMQGQEGVYRWDRDGSLLVWIPPGFFYPGVRDDDPGKTLTQVKVQGFYLARYPVTWHQWERFCRETGHARVARLLDVGDDHPVHGVTWSEAEAYCLWAGLRLPDEVEWEYAARGTESRRFPWGDADPTPAHMNWAGHPQHKGARTTPVGAFPHGASPFGLQDMAGNVQEWTVGGTPQRRPLRGGAFNLPAEVCRPFERIALPGEAREAGIGFRVALSGAPEASESDDLERKRSTRRFTRAEVRAAVPGLVDRPAPPPRPVAPAAPPPPLSPVAPAASARPSGPARPAPLRPATGPVRPATGSGRPPPSGAHPARPATGSLRPGPRPQPGTGGVRPPPGRPGPARPQPGPGPQTGGARPLPPGTGRRPRPGPPPPAPAPSPPPVVSPPPTDRAARVAGPASGQGPVPGTAATGRRPRNTPAQDALLDHVEALLGSFASGIGRKGNELKFTSGEPPLSFSFLALDPHARWACLEQRVTFDPHALQGQPSGRANLLLATNLITHYGRGIRCLATEDRLRYRRELLLAPEGDPILGDELRSNLAILLEAWTAVFSPLRDVQSGVPWHEALASLLEPRAPHNPGVLPLIEESLADLEPERQANRLRVLPDGLEEPIDLVWSDDLCFSTLLRAWAPPLEETMAVRTGEHAPQVEALLEELNLKNATRPYALCWDPKRGVVARTHLAGEPPPRARIMDALGLLSMAVREERFTSLGD